MAMSDRLASKHQALLSALRAVWQERAAALNVLAAKELSAATDASSDPSTLAEREQFENAQAAVERALKRLKWFEYRNMRPPNRKVARRVESPRA
jgi:hypothetical protein